MGDPESSAQRWMMMDGDDLMRPVPGRGAKERSGSVPPPQSASLLFIWGQRWGGEESFSRSALFTAQQHTTTISVWGQP